MSFTIVKHFAVASLALLISACGDSGFDKKTGKTLYQEATQQLYADNAQYNFKADISVDTDAENPMLADLKVKLSGAVDNNAQRYELLPEVEAAVFNLKMPMRIDIKNKELLLDTSHVIDAALMFAPQAKKQLQQYKNKFIRFSPDNFKLYKDDMAEAMLIVSEVVKIGTGAMNEYIKIIPESSIEKLPLDDKAKQLGAKAVLKAKLDREQSQALQQHINTYIRDRVAANDKLSDEIKQNVLEVLVETENDSSYESSEAVIYLDSEGRIIHETNMFNYEAEGEQLNVSMTVNYSNYGKASFTITPDKDQIRNFTEEDMHALQNL